MGTSELKSLKTVIDSGWVTQGPKVAAFEKKFAEFVGTKYAVATSSCTSALQITLAELKLSREDEVITTPFTWESTITGIIYAGATPVLADIDPGTFNISPKSVLEKLSKMTKGIVVVHFAGFPVDMASIKKIAGDNNLFVIEDSAHAIGSEYHGKKTGSLGDSACFSFGSTKTLSTGEGGMITTNDRRKYKKYQILRNYGETKSSMDKKGIGRWTYDIVELTYNFKMNEFAAAIGISQLRRLPQIMIGRRRCFNLYTKALSGIKNITVQQPVEDVDHVPLFFPIVLDEKYKNKRREIMMALEAVGIESGIYYPTIYRLGIFKKIFGEKFHCPVSEKISEAIFSVPCHGHVSPASVEKIAAIIKKYLR